MRDECAKLEGQYKYWRGAYIILRDKEALWIQSLTSFTTVHKIATGFKLCAQKAVYRDLIYYMHREAWQY